MKIKFECVKEVIIFFDISRFWISKVWWKYLDFILHNTISSNIQNSNRLSLGPCIFGDIRKHFEEREIYIYKYTYMDNAKVNRWKLILMLNSEIYLKGKIMDLIFAACEKYSQLTIVVSIIHQYIIFIIIAPFFQKLRNQIHSIYMRSFQFVNQIYITFLHALMPWYRECNLVHSDTTKEIFEHKTTIMKINEIFLRIYYFRILWERKESKS